MRRPRKAGGVVVVLFGLLATGCFPWSGSSRTEIVKGFRGLTGPSPDALYVQTTLIEQSAGDAYLNKGLWAAAGKPLPHELSTLLAMNGIRVGVFTGNPPGEFERLISSESSTVNPTFRTMQPGKPKLVAINGPIERIEYRSFSAIAIDPIRTTAVAAECGLSVSAWPADDQRVRLVCELQLQHGDRQSWIAPNDAGTAFDRQERKTLETFPTLIWEVTLAPGDHLVVGASADPVETLGQAFFFPVVNGVVKQRVFAVKAGHGLATDARPLPTRPTK